MRAPDRTRRGIAAMLALTVLIALALLAALFLEAAHSELRRGSASLAAVRAGAEADGALERGLAHRLDTAAALRPAGAMLLEERPGGADSTLTTIRLLQQGIAEVRATVVTRSGGFRVFAGRVGYVRLRTDSLWPGELVLRPLPGHWWVATP